MLYALITRKGTPVLVFVARAVQFTVLIRHQSQQAYVDFRLVQCCRGGSRHFGHIFRVGYATGHVSARQAWKESFNHGMWLEDASSGGVTVPSWMAQGPRVLPRHRARLRTSFLNTAVSTARSITIGSSLAVVSMACHNISLRISYTKRQARRLRWSMNTNGILHG